jgi:hypothetical protein
MWELDRQSNDRMQILLRVECPNHRQPMVGPSGLPLALMVGDPVRVLRRHGDQERFMVDVLVDLPFDGQVQVSLGIIRNT